MKLDSIHTAHLLGLGGIGVSALARLLVAQGVKVSGCDGSGNAEVDGVEFMGLHSENHITKDITIVVYSPAIPNDNEELVRARELKIPTMSYPEFLGLIARSIPTIAVSGTHGKSTTTALLGHMLIAGDLDPKVIVGAPRIPGFQENYFAGKNNIFVVEGCEYKKGMLDIHPTHVILTNIEADHLDVYAGIDDITHAFSLYTQALPESGFLVYNADDKNILKTITHVSAQKISFGLGDEAIYKAVDIIEEPRRQSFTVLERGIVLVRLTTILPGVYNVRNILAALAMARAFGVTPEVIAQAVRGFTGIGRRFEELGVIDGHMIISDYAHHPTALSLLANAVNERFFDKRALLIFQPHQTDRTIKLQDDFVHVFTNISNLLVSEIYQVRGREDTNPFSVRTLVEDAKLAGNTSIRFAEDLRATKQFIIEHWNEYDVLIFAGAGDIDSLAREILNEEK